jgi:Tol biopolymer transport system component
VIEVGHNSLDFLTNQPVEGELLADLLARGRLPGEDALRYAIEIGSALSCAHGRGLVHGSLSPFTIAVTASGARVLQPPQSADQQWAHYYSPEQVRGEQPDQRSDIFSFGAVLYEMASGKPAFSGSDGALYHAIRELSPPEFNAKTASRAAMDPVISGCLVKDPAARRQRVQNAVIELKLARALTHRRRAVSGALKPVGAAVPADPEKLPDRPRNGAPWPPRPPQPNRRRLRIGPWTALGLLALVMITVTGMAAAALVFLRPQRPAAEVSFRVTLPENLNFPGPPAISPDGRHLAFSATGPEGQRMLWLRPLDDLRMKPIEGTDGAAAPFWSPDGNFIGFFANQYLAKVPVGGGPAERICPAESIPGGGAWNSDNHIVFAPGLDGGLFRVPATGGNPESLLKPDAARSEHAFLWPQFLPDGRHFVFFALTNSLESTGVYAGGLEKPADYKMLFPSETNAVYSAMAGSRSRKDGYLMFVRERIPMALEFHTASLTTEGEPIAIGDAIGSLRSLYLAPISVSGTATLAYQTVGNATRQLVWMARGGRQLAVVRETGDWGPPRVSPDGSRAVSAKLGSDGQADLWVVDAQGSASQFTATTAYEGSPVWSPDGSRVAFFASASAEGNGDLYVKTLGGGRAELLFRSAAPKYPTDWSRDGKYVFFTVASESGKADIWALSTEEARAGAILDSAHTEASATLSTDSRWLAYQSDESGQVEVYVQRFDGVARGAKQRWQISSGGGGMPRWRGDGQELFFVTDNGKMMSVLVRASGHDFEFDAPRLLFQTGPFPKTWNPYDVSRDGQRFLVNVPLEISSGSAITVLTNWTEKLRRVASR